MPPPGEMTSTPVSKPTSPHSLHVVEKVCSTGFYKSTKDFYVRSKGTVVLGTGLAIVERGVDVFSTPLKYVSTRLVEAYPEAVQTFDQVACECIDLLNQKQEGETKAKRRGSKIVRVPTVRTFRKTFRKFPGRQLLAAIDHALDLATRVQHQLDPDGQQGAALDTTGGTDSQTSFEVFDESQTTTTLVPTYTLVRAAHIPLQIWVWLLRYLRRILEFLMGKHTSIRTQSTTLPIARQEEIKKRRKVTPKKRLPSQSTLEVFLNTLLAPLGYRASRVDRRKIYLYSIPTSDGAPANEQKPSEKRKYDDCDSESDFDLAELDDLDDYDSDADPDYVPVSQESSTDSLECDGDPESDYEVSVYPKNLIALKDVSSGPDHPTVKDMSTDIDHPTMKDATTGANQPTMKDATTGANQPAMKDATTDANQQTMKDADANPPTMKDANANEPTIKDADANELAVKDADSTEPTVKDDTSDGPTDQQSYMKDDITDAKHVTMNGHPGITDTTEVTNGDDASTTKDVTASPHVPPSPTLPNTKGVTRSLDHTVVIASEDETGNTRPAIPGCVTPLAGSEPTITGSGPTLAGNGPTPTGSGRTLSESGPIPAGIGPSLARSGPPPTPDVSVSVWDDFTVIDGHTPAVVVGYGRGRPQPVDKPNPPDKINARLGASKPPVSPPDTEPLKDGKANRKGKKNKGNKPKN